MNCDRVSVPTNPDSWLRSGTESRWAFIPLSDIKVLGSDAPLHMGNILTIAFGEVMALMKNDDPWL